MNLEEVQEGSLTHVQLAFNPFTDLIVDLGVLWNTKQTLSAQLPTIRCPTFQFKTSL